MEIIYKNTLLSIKDPNNLIFKTKVAEFTQYFIHVSISLLQGHLLL